MKRGGATTRATALGPFGQAPYPHLRELVSFWLRTTPDTEKKLETHGGARRSRSEAVRGRGRVAESQSEICSVPVRLAMPLPRSTCYAAAPHPLVASSSRLAACRRRVSHRHPADLPLSHLPATHDVVTPPCADSIGHRRPLGTHRRPGPSRQQPWPAPQAARP
jgi:hypothetical protein